MHGAIYVVDLVDQTCKCKIWDLIDISCAHAMAAIFDKNLEVENFVHPCYHMAAYKGANEHFLKPMDGVDMWSKQGLPTVHSLHYHKQPGRPKTMRRRKPSKPS